LPAELIDKSHGWFRDWFRKVWKLRGGGLYACGFAIAFIVLEVGALADDVLGLGAIFNGQAIEFVIDFIIDSFTNTIRALMWPAYVVMWAPPWGALALGAAFMGFTSFLKKPIEGWLFDDDAA
jgi:hypothetical protein